MSTYEASTPATTTAIPVLPLEGVIFAVSDITRWRILDELLKGEPLPVSELGRRLGASANSISKHCAVLQRVGLVLRGFGNLYRISAAFIIPGQRALDFGAVVIRLDRLDQA